LKFSAALMLAFVSIVSSAFAVGRASDPEDELISKKLTSLSASNGGKPIDCGSTTMNGPEGKLAVCAKAAFEDREPFYISYSGTPFAFFKFAYGMGEHL
jgi:hypothetical protein